MIAAETVEAGWFLEHAYLVPLIMAASFGLTLAIGKRLGKNASWIGIVAIGTCFLFAIAANVQWNSYVHDSEHAGEAGTHGDEDPHADETDSHGEEDPAADDHSGDEAPADDHADDPAAEEEHSAGATDVVGPLVDGESAAARAPPVVAEEAGEDEHHAPEYEVVPVTQTWTWWTSGTIEFQAGMLLDGMAVMMLFVVTLISLLVHVFSTDYVAGDRRYTHYFAFLSLFSAAMLGFVMAQNTLQLITMWELVGVCSFALIGHWWEEKPNSDAALKAFLTNRVGDVGLLVGMITLFFAANQTFDIVEINTLANEGAITHTALLVSSLCLLAAVMSKSGQFILHTWLPDAMAGPTPVSALIHAATMVVAGVFMVARMYGVFWNGLVIGGSSINALAVVGGVTVIGGAGLAFVQSDIKKVLAYSTISQLGYMVMALGVGAWTAGMFHLFTHAFFKAGLFLGAGSVAHAVHSFDMKKDMGGMKQFMPKTFVTFMICTGALIGIFPLAGFWSKDEILAGADQLGSGYTAFMVVGSIGAFMTAAYMTRLIYLTFFGEYRGGHHDDDHADAHDGDHAADHDDDHAEAHGDPHESGPRILVPLYILATLAVVAGFTNLPDTGALSFIPEGLALRFEHLYEPVGAYFPSFGSVEAAFAHPEFSWQIAVGSSLVGFLGIGLAYAWYFKGMGPHGITERSKLAKAGHTFLVEKYYLDHLYTGIIAGGVKGPIAKGVNWFNKHGLDGIVDGAGKSAVVGGKFVYNTIDQKFVDGIVDGSGATAEGGGQVFRQMQTGKVQQYAAILFVASVVLAGAFIIVI
ncbi:NADH-quinone oxidoreductase subunit 5 family protein [Actinospongicola halichondriae]|uniref:NADH-quinone oxidoreductase subunit 5 family protein n=1 Tax=Actinospongicola halichondriae TaxID=3236844 RepID=UPI003D3A93E0